MTEQQSYELGQYARSLFAQCKWNDAQWDALLDALKYQPYEVAKRAVKQHFQETRYATPTIGAVVKNANVIRFGSANRSDCQVQRGRTPDQTVAELRSAWEYATRMFTEEQALRWMASSAGQRLVGELLRDGWTQDQVDVVVQEVTGGRVRDSFRGDCQGLQESWRQRFGRYPPPECNGRRIPISSGGGGEDGLRFGPVQDGPVVDEGDGGTAGAQEPYGGGRSDAEDSGSPGTDW